MPRGPVPNFHSFRHPAASEAIAAADGAGEVFWQLGHRNSNVTRSVYVQRIKSAERTAKMEARYGSLVEAAGRISTNDDERREGAEVLPLRQAEST